MTNPKPAELAVGLLGVFALLQALVGVMSIFATVAIVPNGVSMGGVLLSQIVPVALLLGVGYLLVFHNATVAAVIFLRAEAAPADEAPRRDDLAEVLVGVVGVLLLGMAVPGVVRAAFTYSVTREFQAMPSHAFQVRDFIGSGAQAALALFLVLRPARVVTLWRPAHQPDEPGEG